MIETDSPSFSSKSAHSLRGQHHEGGGRAGGWMHGVGARAAAHTARQEHRHAHPDGSVWTGCLWQGTTNPWAAKARGRRSPLAQVCLECGPSLALHNEYIRLVADLQAQDEVTVGAPCVQQQSWGEPLALLQTAAQ